MENVPPFAILEDNLLLPMVNPPITPFWALIPIVYICDASSNDVLMYPFMIVVDCFPVRAFIKSLTLSSATPVSS